MREIYTGTYFFGHIFTVMRDALRSSIYNSCIQHSHISHIIALTEFIPFLPHIPHSHQSTHMPTTTTA
jgi:hypothetical protein